MPHIPRSISPTGQLGPIDAPRAEPRKAISKPPVPYMGSGKGEVDPASRLRGNKMVGKLSMKDWDVDPMRVLKQITGKEMVSDEHSGMVSDPERSS